MNKLDNLVNAKFLDLEETPSKRSFGCDCYTNPCDDIGKTYPLKNSDDSTTANSEVYELE